MAMTLMMMVATFILESTMMITLVNDNDDSGVNACDNDDPCVDDAADQMLKIIMTMTLAMTLELPH